MNLIVKYKVWFESEKGDFVLGPGGIELLKAIHETGSIRKACEKCGWSYKHALNYLNSLEKALGTKITVRKRGGRRGGGTVLTDEALRLVNAYSEICRKIEEGIHEVKFKNIRGSSSHHGGESEPHRFTHP